MSKENKTSGLLVGTGDSIIVSDNSPKYHNFRYGIKSYNIHYLDNTKEKISFWLYKTEKYNGNQNINDVARDEVVVIKPNKTMVWFNIPGETLSRVLYLNLRNTDNTEYTIYRFKDNIAERTYGYYVRNNEGGRVFYAGIFGLKLIMVTPSTYKAIHQGVIFGNLKNYGYVVNSIGTPPINIKTTSDGRVVSMSYKGVENAGIIGVMNNRLCISDFKNNYYTGSSPLNHCYGMWFDSYFGLIAELP